jgi:PadR family transcriptional regulator, regulatory protein PadR
MSTIFSSVTCLDRKPIFHLLLVQNRVWMLFTWLRLILINLFVKSMENTTLEFHTLANIFPIRRFTLDANAKDSFRSVSSLEEDILSLLLGKELYGAKIVEAICEVTQGKRRIGVGSLYPTLNRMEQKGYVSSRVDEERILERGGARRKYYKITALGAAALTDTQRFRKNLANWKPGGLDSPVTA